MREGDVGGIPSLRNEDPPKPDSVISRIEGEPALAEINLHPSRKVHRRIRWRKTDIADIAGAIARGNVEAAAERDREVREVTADANALGIGLGCRAGGACVFIAENEVVMHEVADGLDPLPAERRMLE